MSFLRGRLGAQEGKYFKEENELAAARLKRLRQKDNAGSPPSPGSVGQKLAAEEVVDMLPEILQHSLPLHMPQEARIIREPVLKRDWEDLSSLDAKSRSTQSMRPVGHVPETRLGRSKYQVDIPVSNGLKASTANMRRASTADAAKVHSLMRGLNSVSKAFGVATVAVYGGGIAAFFLTCRALEINQLEDIPAKGAELMQPQIERWRESMKPLRVWAEGQTVRWRLTEEEQRAVGARFARVLGVGASSAQLEQETQQSAAK